MAARFNYTGTAKLKEDASKVRFVIYEGERLNPVSFYGLYETTGRGELVEAIREALGFYGYPRDTVYQYSFIKLWPAIKAHPTAMRLDYGSTPKVNILAIGIDSYNHIAHHGITQEVSELLTNRENA